MNIQLLQGNFGNDEALELISPMVNIKIKYHENKISTHYNEEDIKTRESKINQLQNEHFELRKIINLQTNGVKLETTIKIEEE